MCLGPLCLMCCVNMEALGRLSLWRWWVKCKPQHPATGSLLQAFRRQNAHQSQRSTELGLTWARTDYPHVGPQSTASDGHPQEGPREQRALLTKAPVAVHGKDAWDFLKGNLPWLHRCQQGHRNMNTFIACSLNLGAL